MLPENIGKIGIIQGGPFKPFFGSPQQSTPEEIQAEFEEFERVKQEKILKAKAELDNIGRRLIMESGFSLTQEVMDKADSIIKILWRDVNRKQRRQAVRDKQFYIGLLSKEEQTSLKNQRKNLDRIERLKKSAK